MNLKPCSATDWEVEQVQRVIAACAVQPGVYVEIGSFAGGSFAAYGDMMPFGSTLIAIDRPLNRDAMAELQHVSHTLRDKAFDAHVVEGDSCSTDVVDRLKTILDGHAIDVLFVDGDHSPAGCTADLETYLPLVREGGLVIMHDCGLPGQAKGVTDKVAAVLAGLHEVWLKYSAGKKRVLIQEWCGYGGWIQ